MYEYLDQSVLIELYPLLPNDPGVLDVERVLLENFGAPSYLFVPLYVVDLHAKATDMSDNVTAAAWSRAVMIMS
ncbi:hypothetical protein SARC_09163 [Sphaeroforma arctica JP610]|uniref:Uncharacterized protein n=1 Tax=Sphaeroforma arctica JP610 TaxID=667725 RepID=A0A0L0FNT3_9EUKA|nr:hypothetical protein SARC_09163 [Sphaeroforma arctica JP610]KNC78404.1 hypothetical protein SARC_09163 [Sphaeroforma arctica JP610]|eukprot:XP_014152306.1 hypothetical protein SARC_09163 [Sphaeroforma arctica JP610]